MTDSAVNIPLASIQIALALLVPLVTVWLEKRSRIVRFLSPVVVCYAVGMLFGNQPWVHFSTGLSLTACNVTVAMAIPLLLFSVNIVAWLKLARNTVLSFFFCMISVMLVAALAHVIFRPYLPESEKIAGMLVGVYTGGTPNMAAIGTALRVKPETFILLNAADMVASFAYLFFILTLAGRLLAHLVPATPRTGDSEDEQGSPQASIGLPPAGVIFPGLLLTGLIVAAAVGVGWLCPESVREAVSILVITSLSVGASLLPKVRAMRGTHDMGQFLLLVFCVAMGFTTDFSRLFTSTMTTVLFVAVVLFGSVILHFALAIIFKIDRDTIIITSAAAIFGPHMVGPVALAIKNRQVLFSGLASGLVGYAVGNYLGIALAWMLG
ncbi:MAG TPA: DUF819 family protein [Myxococcota bacterium]|nr:DUF819 family protein [Myxococcota bacterium]